MSTQTECKTPDGLIVHELRGVGLVVSASEHNREVARLRKALAEIEKMPWPDSDAPYARVARSALANGRDEPRP